MTVLLRSGGRFVRSGPRLLRRPAYPALPVGGTTPPPAEPPPPPAVDMPTTPHLTVSSAHGNVHVLRQDGYTAEVRLKRPIYPFTEILDVAVNRTAAGPSKAPYWGGNPGGYLMTQNWRPAVNRELLSTDDGTYTTEIYQELDDGTYIVLDIILSVSPEAVGEAPPPSPVPAIDSRVFFEDFAPRTGTGALWVSNGNVWNTGNGTVRIDGIGSANQEFGGPAFGFPNGLFEYRSRYYGDDIGDGSGPCQLLWPSDDRWPGSEIDLGELFPAGTDPVNGGGIFYHAVHWAADGQIGVGGDANDGEQLYAVKDNPDIAPGGVFDHRLWHTYGALLLNDRVVLYVDGKVLADFPTDTARDFKNGGVNHSFGILCGSNGRGIEVDWCRWTPAAMVSGGAATAMRNDDLQEDTAPVAA